GVIAENILPVAAHEEAETIHNMTAENKLYFQAEKEAIFLILTGIRDEIYSTVDARNTSKEMWTAIERLQQGESLNVQGESLNIQDVKTNLFWEFGKFTSRDGESIESYYSRFVTVVKQREEIDTVSYHRLFDVLKQFQNEVNDIRSERLAKSANPLALLTQRKEIAKPVTPQSESVSEEDSDPEQAQRDKDIQKNLALLAKYFKKLYKPTNNNLRTSSNFRNKTEDTTQDSPVVQQTGILCFNYKGFGHYAKECRKPKRVKDYTYHKEKKMMCKQAEEIDEQELEAHYSFMAKIQEVLPEES
ncbi:retrovirus-related pol polyprotein from transposon TNT 1-94, partial [Tanacetum coccineum]